VAAHDFKTVMDSLNYLKALGVNAIELMPFNEFEGN
jgi:1,4-alpha-glucan branching enzyme